MLTRRSFMKTGLASALYPKFLLKEEGVRMERSDGESVVISTRSFGLDANREAMKILQEGRSALDAVEAGIRTSVSLDACIMDSDGIAGSGGKPELLHNKCSESRVNMALIFR